MAIEHYTSAIKFNNTSEVPVNLINCYYNRGNAYLATKYFESAVKDFNYVTNENQEFASAFHNRAIALRHLKKNEEACMDFKMAKKRVVQSPAYSLTNIGNYSGIKSLI